VKARKPIWHEEANMFLAANYDDANAVLRNKALGRIFKPRTPETNGTHLIGYMQIQFLTLNLLSALVFAR
jgi:hypothetical protein